jgi:hypothetical protein
MTSTLTYQRMGTTARGQTHALFAQTMGYVALTAALFAFGAWLGRDLTGGVGIVAFIAGFAWTRGRCGKPAGRPRCSSPGSARRAPPPAVT